MITQEQNMMSKQAEKCDRSTDENRIHSIKTQDRHFLLILILLLCHTTTAYKHKMNIEINIEDCRR